MYDVILVATDGSDPANRAVEHALAMAEEYDADLHVLSVIDVGRYGEPALSSAELVVDELEDRTEALLDDIADRADNQGIAVTTRCVHGRPQDEIVAYANEVDADVTVMGYQGQSHTKTNRIGSVAERVVRAADRPVFLT